MPANLVLTGILLMSAGMSLIGLVDAIAKLLAQDLHGVHVAWGYFVGMFVSLLAYLLISGRGLRQALNASRPGLQWARSVCIVGSLSFLFSSFSFLPLADATVISFTAPLIIVALAGPLLGETVGAKRWAAVLIGMSGALLVIRPGTDVFQWAAVLPLVSAVFFAFFNLATRAIGSADPLLTTLFYTSGGSALLLTPSLPWVWQNLDIAQCVVMLLVGAMGLIAHLLIARAIQLAPVSAVAPLNYVRLIWAVSLGYFWFGNVPDALAVVGGCVIVASGLFAVSLEARRSSRA